MKTISLTVTKDDLPKMNEEFRISLLNISTSGFYNSFQFHYYLILLITDQVIYYIYNIYQGLYYIYNIDQVLYYIYNIELDLYYIYNIELDLYYIYNIYQVLYYIYNIYQVLYYIYNIDHIDLHV